MNSWRVLPQTSPRQITDTSWEGVVPLFYSVAVLSSSPFSVCESFYAPLFIYLYLYSTKLKDIHPPSLPILSSHVWESERQWWIQVPAHDLCSWVFEPKSSLDILTILTPQNGWDCKLHGWVRWVRLSCHWLQIQPLSKLLLRLGEPSRAECWE